MATTLLGREQFARHFFFFKKKRKKGALCPASMVTELGDAAPGPGDSPSHSTPLGQIGNNQNLPMCQRHLGLWGNFE